MLLACLYILEIVALAAVPEESFFLSRVYDIRIKGYFEALSDMRKFSVSDWMRLTGRIQNVSNL